MTHRLLNNTTFLILGIIIFLIGCIQPSAYEEAKENGYEVEATIVNVVEKESFDGDSITYTVYADYTVDGKEYKNVKIGKYYDTDAYYVGKTVKVVVDPDNPGKPMFEGGILCTIGFVMTIGAIISKIRNRKRKAL